LEHVLPRSVAWRAVVNGPGTARAAAPLVGYQLL